MTGSPADKETALTRLRARFAASSDGVIETLAEEYGLTPLEVAGCLPDSTGARVGGRMFREIMNDVADWGPITFLVHTADLILECTGTIPKGTIAQGYYNLLGDGPIGGHLREQRCTDIQFVSRNFMGQDSHAIMFFNAEGGIMFKIFVGRDSRFRLLPDQVPRFLALRDRLTAWENADANV